MLDTYINLLKKGNQALFEYYDNNSDDITLAGELSNKPSEEDVIRFLFKKFVVLNDKMLLISDGLIHRINSKNAFFVMAEMQLRRNYPLLKIFTVTEKGKRVWNIDINSIYETINSVNDFQMLRYESDLFADKQKVEVNYDTKVITVVGNKIHIKELENFNIPQSIQKDVLSDYKSHFKEFDELLNLIIDMRFAKDRKASFLHMRVKSNWGKSFLSGLLKNLQIGFEIDYQNLMNTGASSISPIQVRNSFVLILDEFNNFSQEMKKLSHEFTFAPKFGQSETIELYLKILMSAEKSPSFSGGVDAQIINRVMVFDIDDKEAVELKERAMYKKYGNSRYMAVLERYAHDFLHERLAQYLSMEKHEAHKRADERVAIALSKYKMKAESLNDNTKYIINDAIYNILQTADGDYSLNNKLRELKSNIIEIRKGKHDGKIFIKSPQKVFETILKIETSENEYKKMRYKLNNLEEVVNLVADHRGSAAKINNQSKSQKGIIIDIEEPRTASEIIEELKESGNLIIEEKVDKDGNLVDVDGNAIF